MYELWCGGVMDGYVREEQLPFDIQQRRRRTRDAFDPTGTKTPRGPPSLVNTTLRLLSRYMDASPINPTGESSWLASTDVKRYLGDQARMAIMVHGVWEGWATWRGVRDLAAGSDEDGRKVEDLSGKEEPEEEDDWDAESSISETASPIPNLPILDLSFCQITTAREHRHLSRYLSSSTVRASVEAISFAGTPLSPLQAIDLLSIAHGKSGAWVKLKNVSLAGLRGSEEEWKVGLGKLTRCAPGLEVSFRCDTVVASSVEIESR